MTINRAVNRSDENTTGAAGSLVHRADELFSQYSVYEGDGFRNHCRRLFELTSMLLDAGGIELDRDVAYAIALTHDLGILSERDEGTTFLARSFSLFEREMHDQNLAGTSRRVIEECMLYNHRVRPVPNLGPQAEAFRRAVWIEHTRGHRRYGLDRDAVREVFDRHPRGNFDRVLLDFFWRTVRAEPTTIVSGILF
jgi:hypothetical protein